MWRVEGGGGPCMSVIAASPTCLIARLQGSKVILRRASGADIACIHNCTIDSFLARQQRAHKCGSLSEADACSRSNHRFFDCAILNY